MFNLVLISPLIIGCASLIYSKRALEKKKFQDKNARHWCTGNLCVLYFFLHVIASQVTGMKKRPQFFLFFFLFVQLHITVVL